MSHFLLAMAAVNSPQDSLLHHVLTLIRSSTLVHDTGLTPLSMTVMAIHACITLRLADRRFHSSHQSMHGRFYCASYDVEGVRHWSIVPTLVDSSVIAFGFSQICGMSFTMFTSPAVVFTSNDSGALVVNQAALAGLQTEVNVIIDRFLQPSSERSQTGMRVHRM